MNHILKTWVRNIIAFLWGSYALYMVLFGDLLLFPKDSFEVILPAIMQIVAAIVFVRLFTERYLVISSLTALACCLLVILWHFNLNHGISRKQVVMLFLVIPIFTTAVTYFVGKIKKTVSLSIWKNFGVSLMLTFVSFLFAVFTFYIFHYWI